MGRRIGDVSVYSRYLLLLVGLVVVPTVLLALYGVSSIRHEQLALRAQLREVWRVQARQVEDALLAAVGVAEHAIRQTTDPELSTLAANEPSLKAVWRLDGEVPLAVMELAQAAPIDETVRWASLYPDEGPTRVLGLVRRGGLDLAFELDPERLTEEVVKPVSEALAKGDATFALVTDTRPIPETLTVEQRLRQLAQGDDAFPILFETPLPAPLDAWRLRVELVEGAADAGRIASAELVNVTAVVLLCFAVLAGVVLASRTMARELRLSQLQTDFVSNVSHELRTPLTSIRLFIDTLQTGRIQDAERVQECLDVLALESGRLSRMIERVLGWARMEAGRRIYEFEACRPADLVDQALEAFLTQQLGQAELELDVQIDADLPHVRADRDAVSEALLNILNNAVKYTGTQKEIRVRARPDRKRIGLSVHDNGPGVPRSERKRIFEKFYRPDALLSRATQGSGLGLAIVRSIARAHRGAVEVESEEGRGAEFTLWLPVAR